LRVAARIARGLATSYLAWPHEFLAIAGLRLIPARSFQGPAGQQYDASGVAAFGRRSVRRVDSDVDDACEPRIAFASSASTVLTKVLATAQRIEVCEQYRIQRLSGVATTA
jgi:hypothetical protein